MDLERTTAQPTHSTPFRAVFLVTLGALLTAGSPAPVSGQEVFFERDAFLAATGAKLATPNEFPNLGFLGSEPYQNGEVTCQAVGNSGLDLSNWTARLPIDSGGSTIDIAIFGTENLDQKGAPVVEVESFAFSPQDHPGMRFFGLQTDGLLNRVEIRETSAQNENEFFGKVYIEAPIRRLFITPELVSGDLSLGPGVSTEVGIESARGRGCHLPRRGSSRRSYAA